MKTNFFIYIILLIAYMFFVQSAKAEDIHFNNDVFNLKNSHIITADNSYENEYFLSGETKNNWSKMIGIYYYPDIANPLKYAEQADKDVEARPGVVLLKFIQNKKQDKALLSFLENGEFNGKNYFEYNIYKYEKHPNKGMMVLRYVKRYFFKTNDEITKIGHEVKSINDDLLEQIIISPIPPIVEKEL